MSAGDVFALGRIIPEGDVIQIAAPFGASDARVDRLEVTVGDRVEEGQVLAILDNAEQLRLALDAAVAELDVKKMVLAQTEDAVRASRDEAAASLERAKATATAAEADRDVATWRATLSRFEGSSN